MEPIGWPDGVGELAALQQRLAAARPSPWEAKGSPVVGASAVCFSRGADPPAGPLADPLADPHEAAQRGWAAASRKRPGSQASVVVIEGAGEAGYRPGLLALREGRLRHDALEALSALPDVVIVDATGRDHPRQAGLALHLGAVVGVPTVGATDRPLVATAAQPEGHRGATAPLWLAGEVVGYACRTRAGTRPVCVSAGWRTTPDVAATVVIGAATRARTPQPLREARREVRAARDRAGG